MDRKHLIDSKPSIKLRVVVGRKKGVLNLSALYGSYLIQSSVPLPQGKIVKVFCPSCKKEFSGSRTCEQCQAEARWHRQACEETEHREQGLKQQLDTILDLIGQGKLPDTSFAPGSFPGDSFADVRSTERTARTGLWQRLRNLVRGEGLHRSAGGEPFTAPVQASGRSPVDEIEGSTASFHHPEAAATALFPRESDEGQPQPCPTLVVYCLGPFRVYRDDRLIEKWPGHKCTSVFKYLLVHRACPVPRDVLCDLFWRDAEPDAARQSLYQAIYRLRKALEADEAESYILFNDGCYCLNPDIPLWIDSEAFLLHYQAGQQSERRGLVQQAIEAYEAAADLYEGEFLAEDIYEDWTLAHREHLKHIHLNLLDQLSQHYYRQGQFVRSITFSRQMLAQDNCREDAHRRLMRCYLRQGQRHLALRQYHRCMETLKSELDVPPMPATTRLYDMIRQEQTHFPDA